VLCCLQADAVTKTESEMYDIHLLARCYSTIHTDEHLQCFAARRPMR
jgi:hypothetical protein